MRPVDTNVLVRLVTRDQPKQVAVRFSDCLVIELARKAGHLPLGSFDREFSKLDGVERLQG